MQKWKCEVENNPQPNPFRFISSLKPKDKAFVQTSWLGGWTSDLHNFDTLIYM